MASASEMTSGNVVDKIKIYSEYRSSVNRRGVWVVLIPPALLALARSPEFKLDDFFGLVDGSFHNGYVGAYGHFIVLVLAGVYWAGLVSCASLYAVVRGDLPDEQIHGHRRLTEAYLLRPPFSVRRATSWRDPARWQTMVPLFVAAVVYGILLFDYFGFHAPNRLDERFHDLLWGLNDQGHFKAQWKWGMPSNPTINAPLQTWAGLLGAVLLAFFFGHGFKVLQQYERNLGEKLNPNSTGGGR